MNQRILHFSLTISVSVNLFHVCAELFHLCAVSSEKCYPPAEIECVLNSAICFRQAFSLLMKYLRACHTLHYLTEQQNCSIKTIVWLRLSLETRFVSGFRYDPQNNKWGKVASMSTRRLGVGVAVLQGYLYAVGGSDGTCPLNTGKHRL